MRIGDVIECRYVPHHLVPEYRAAGWTIEALGGPHAHYSMLASRKVNEEATTERENVRRLEGPEAMKDKRFVALCIFGLVVGCALFVIGTILLFVYPPDFRGEAMMSRPYSLRPAGLTDHRALLHPGIEGSLQGFLEAHDRDVVEVEAVHFAFLQRLYADNLGGDLQDDAVAVGHGRVSVCSAGPFPALDDTRIAL